ncbi:hypothetical protein M9Y10_010006 [Tritrichomonas musculus]|uniref:Cytoplasmic envelopment protein 3 n=1 Tax=Tritrichomonas musculus TaxID=1915356 RepID=A0ABR2IQ58_9EUKA
MGCLSSICKNNVQNDLEDQYQTLVITKPPPVILNTIHQDIDAESDVPLFDQVSSGDEPIIPNPESISDEEFNLYAESLNKKD